MPPSRPFRSAFLLAALLALAGCGGGESGPGPSELVVAKAAAGDGDEQTGEPGDVLKEPLRVVVTRDGQPVVDEDVEWDTDDGGSVDPVRATTDASGIAETFWTLGDAVGEQIATAEVDGADGSPVTFRATAETPGAGGAVVQVLSDPTPRFQPENVNIVVGQTVTWIWRAGGLSHNVAPDDEVPARSGAPTVGPAEYEYTFTAPGDYQYHCEVHPGMTGTVTVAAVAP